MKKRILRLKKAVHLVLLGLLLSAAGMTKAYAQNISFADDNVKAICVSNWDTDGDGELSYAEAAAVTDIGQVFKQNGSITSFDELQFFTGLSSIGSEAFSNCTGLTSIIIPSSVTNIHEWAFDICSGLVQIVVDPSNTVYDSRDNCNAIIETATNTLVKGCQTTMIPVVVTTIGNSAFYGCLTLTSIDIPNAVTIIEDYAFGGCTGLTSIKIDALVPPTIGSNVFYGSTCPIYVPYESLAAYLNDWSQYESRIQPFVQRSVAGYGESANGKWAFIASPLAENTAPTDIENMTTDDYDLYSFDQSEQLEWRNHKVEGFSIENGQGYLYGSKEDADIVFKGIFNEGTSQEIGLSYDGNASLAGWNLVGNPFPYAATVSRSYYVMNEAGTGIDPIALSENTSIEACTGIMVKAETTDETVTFAKPTRTTVENKGLLHIAVAASTGSVADKAIVSFNDGDELGKYYFGGQNASIYIPQDGKEYAIATVGGNATEVPVNFKAAKNGTYTLTVNVDGMDLEYLHLIDNMTGADVDLLSPAGSPFAKGVGGFNEPAIYTFTAKTTDYASRFKLVFNVNDASTNSVSDAPFAYISNGEIIVNGEGTLQVIDMLGHVVRAVGLSHRGRRTITGIPAGVYVLRLIDGDSVRTQKIVIQ